MSDRVVLFKLVQPKGVGFRLKMWLRYGRHNLLIVGAIFVCAVVLVAFFEVKIWPHFGDKWIWVGYAATHDGDAVNFLAKFSKADRSLREHVVINYPTPEEYPSRFKELHERWTANIREFKCSKNELVGFDDWADGLVGLRTYLAAPSAIFRRANELIFNRFFCEDIAGVKILDFIGCWRRTQCFP